MDTILAILALLLAVIGLAGCIVPMLPGPPISYLGLILVACTSFSTLSWGVMLLFLAVTLAVTAADYFLPAVLSRRFGGSRAGAVGATLGAIGGFFFFPPLGIILGPFAGAVLGELTNNRDDVARAFRVGVGAFLSFIVGTGLKLAASVAMLLYIFRDVWAPFKAWWAALAA